MTGHSNWLSIIQKQYRKGLIVVLFLLFSALDLGICFAFGQDYEGDGKEDLAIYDPRGGTYSVRYSSTLEIQQFFSVPVGSVPVPLDRNGDGKSDPAVFSRVTGEWWFSVNGESSVVDFGELGDIPVPGSWFDNACDDLAVFEPRVNRYRIKNCLTASEEQIEIGSFSYPAVPVPADYDGDGRLDAATWEPNEAWWFIKYSSGKESVRFQFGELGDAPLPDDFDGDGLAEPAVYRGASAHGSYPTQPRVIVYREGTPPSEFVWGKEGQNLFICDVTGDKKPDFVSHYGSGQSFDIRTSDVGDLLGVGFGSYQNRYSGLAAYPGNFTNHRIRTGDLSGSGRSEMVFVRSQEFGLQWSIYSVSGGGSWRSFGLPGDLPLLGDFAGERRKIPAIARNNGGFLDWYILKGLETEELFLPSFGLAGDRVFAGDLDCDGHDDAVVLRAAAGYLSWFWRTSGTSYFNHDFTKIWGLAGDTPFIADLNGDGCDELLVARPFSGAMRWLSFSPQLGVEKIVDFGLASDIPFQPVDYDGDGEDDPVVIRAEAWPGDTTYHVILVQAGRRLLPGEYPFPVLNYTEGTVIAGHFTGTRFAEFGILAPETGEGAGFSFYRRFDGKTEFLSVGLGDDVSAANLIAPAHAGQ